MTEATEPHLSDTRQKSRVRTSAGVASGPLVIGVLVGGIWAWIAPSIHGVVALNHSGERVHDYLGNESQHFFVAPFLMLGLLSVVAVVAPVLAWQWRERRGPRMVVRLTIGLAAAAASAAAAGALGVHLRYGSVNISGIPLTKDHAVRYFTEAPPVFFGHTPLQVACTVLLPVGAGALVYAVLVAAAAHDDLGGSPAADAPGPPAVVALSPKGVEPAAES